MTRNGYSDCLFGFSPECDYSMYDGWLVSVLDNFFIFASTQL